jgi:hypothetical protein
MMGSPAGPVYWGMFFVSAVVTLLALSFSNPLSEMALDAYSRDYRFRRVLFLEHEPAFQQAFAKVLASYGAHVETLELWKGDKLDWIIGNYDLVIADAKLPYGMLFQLKSTVEKQSRSQVFVVVSVSTAYPHTSPRTQSFEIIESSGPPSLRRKIERVLSAVPA